MTTVLIRYKSGQEVKVKVDGLTVTWDRASGEVTKMEWTNMIPQPLMLGLPNIESVWEL